MPHTACQMPLTLLCTDVPGCAVSRGGRVGLDIEDGGRGTRQRPLALARRHFSPAEIAALAGGPLTGFLRSASEAVIATAAYVQETVHVTETLFMRLFTTSCRHH